MQSSARKDLGERHTVKGLKECDKSTFGIKEGQETKIKGSWDQILEGLWVLFERFFFLAFWALRSH